MQKKTDDKKSKAAFYYGSKQDIFNKTRKLRRESTYTESLFWEVIRNGKVDGFKFRRQHPISSFIADFYCHEAKLIIELDGDVHEVEEVKKRDKIRERVLIEYGLTILRFTNEEVLSDLDKVIEKVREYLKRPHPALSYEERVESRPQHKQLEEKRPRPALSYEEREKSRPQPPTNEERVIRKAIFCWSGGKDSSFALYKVLLEKEYEVVALFTTVNENFKRVSMHGVKEELIEEQAKSIGLPLLKMYVKEGSNDEYERKMESFLSEQKSKGVDYVIFGDIFLEDLRAYRDNNLAKVGMTGVYPLWKMNTTQLANEFIEKGFKTILCCTNDAFLGEKEVGILFDFNFLNNLPATIDPCGENGEFHTFCFDGPIFKKPLNIVAKEKIYRPLEIKTDSASKTQGFWFCELTHP
ncbi:MAG TPA: diphthine--ammonia ligase [Bacteroidia bacterium]|nr:diphthine--ammonia ligase [Bacteroidia bacterium]